jgi:hypothetical protein
VANVLLTCPIEAKLLNVHQHICVATCYLKEFRIQNKSITGETGQPEVKDPLVSIVDIGYDYELLYEGQKEIKKNIN